MKTHADFAEKVYAAVRRIPKGRVASYGQIAEVIGCKGGARAVGNALHVNPYAPQVPCHRVVAADGSLATKFGCGGVAVQYDRLAGEGVCFKLQTKAKAIPKVDLVRCGIVIGPTPRQVKDQ